MMRKHVGRHYELVYSHPRARVDTGTLECDAIMREWRNGDMTSPLVKKKKNREREICKYKQIVSPKSKTKLVWHIVQ